MRELVFITGGNIRKVFIDKRRITLLTAELKYQPYIIDLDALNSEDYLTKMKETKLSKDSDKLLGQLALLNTEEEIMQDIKKDFQSSGWRLIQIR